MDTIKELSQFLSSRRAKVTPEQAGLPNYGRRQVPGLRREEVASLAGGTFAEQHDFTGKTVLPITTYAVSGLGTAADEYADASRGAAIGRGLAVRGERVRDAGDEVDAWLRRVRLRRVA